MLSMIIFLFDLHIITRFQYTDRIRTETWLGVQICFGETSSAKLQNWVQKHYDGNLQLTV